MYVETGQLISPNEQESYRSVSSQVFSTSRKYLTVTVDALSMMMISISMMMYLCICMRLSVNVKNC